MLELMTSDTRSSDTRSAHEISMRVRQIERDLAIRGARPVSDSGPNGAAGVEIKEPAPIAADPTTSNGVSKTLTPSRSETEPRGIGHLLLKGLCRLGIHHGGWWYPLEGACAQKQECGTCNSVQTRIKHSRHWRYILDKNCGQVRTCTRCDATDKNRVKHEKWSKSWDVDSSTAAHRCLRCGEVVEWSTDDD